jgi:hypothetical protein
MAHLQVHIDKDLLKEVKKAAIEQDITVKDYVHKAFQTQLEADKVEEEETINQSNTKKS